MIIALFSETFSSRGFLKQKTNEGPANRWAFFVRDVARYLGKERVAYDQKVKRQIAFPKLRPHMPSKACCHS